MLPGAPTLARAPESAAPHAEPRGGLAAPAHVLHRARLFIDARHGLGNRLRAIASAAVIARRTDRELVIVWEPDDHCACRFGALFRHDGAVIETAFPRLVALAGGTVYNYMAIEPGAQKDAPILPDEGAPILGDEGAPILGDRGAPILGDAPPGRGGSRGDVYVRSAYPLVSPHVVPREVRAWLQALQPVPEVRDLVRSVRHPNQVAAHVRMASGPGYEHLSYESPANWPAEDHARLVAWRQRSHARHFMARLDALVAEGQAESIFLAADLPETYEAFRDRYGARLSWLPRDRHDRSSEQIRHALADMLLLGLAERILGSTWSSFTDMARLLSRRVAVAEMSGRDF